MTRQRDIDVAADAGADAIGVICDLPVDTPREVTRDRAATLVESVPPFVTSVLVTMPTDAAEAIELLDAVGPDVIQLHGVREPDMIETIRAHRPVVLALDASDATAIEALDGIADAILVDSTDERGAGGTGDTHDWDRARTHVESIDSPLILAGGLTPTNVADAIDQVRPFAVDVASGVEGETGKDDDAVRTFVARAQQRTEVA